MADQTTDEGSAAGLTFVHTAQAAELSDDAERPCVYCNHDQIVNERRAEARHWAEQTIQNPTDTRDQPSHYQNPLPAGTVVGFDFASGHKVGTITGHETNDAAKRVAYLTDEYGKVAASRVDSLGKLPETIGKVMADYVFTFGDPEGASAQVPVCDSCMVDMPVEHADANVHDDIPYQYDGDGEVVQKVRETRDGTMWVLRKPVDEHGNIVDEEGDQ